MLLKLTTMKSKYAIFNESGVFVRFESIDPQEVPAIPLAGDGQPRAVAVPTEPELPAGKAHAFGRAGWIEVDAEPAPVPAYLPAWRILSVMDLHDYTPTVEAIIDSLPVSAKKVAKRQIAGSNIERNHALVLAAQQALGLTDAQVDDLFREADALV